MASHSRLVTIRRSQALGANPPASESVFGGTVQPFDSLGGAIDVGNAHRRPNTFVFGNGSAHHSEAGRAALQRREETRPANRATLLRQREYGARNPGSYGGRHLYPPLPVEDIGYGAGAVIAQLEHLNSTYRSRAIYSDINQRNITRTYPHAHGYMERRLREFGVLPVTPHDRARVANARGVRASAMHRAQRNYAVAPIPRIPSTGQPIPHLPDDLPRSARRPFTRLRRRGG